MTDTFRQQLINTITKDFNDNPYFGLYYLDEYSLHIDQWPEFVPLLEKFKATFIKNMLKGFNDDNYEHIETTLKRLKAVGVKWPELDAIQRSYDSMTKSWPDDDVLEGEIKVNKPRSLNADDLGTIRKISAMLHKDHVGDALWMSFELPSRIDELHSIFQHYKTTIMKFLLKEVQKGTGTHLLEIVLDGLARQTITWPELAIVKKTVYSNDYKNI